MHKHTLGPWIWDSIASGGQEIPVLITPDRGRLLVMDFVRSGMQRARPRFAVRSDNKGGIMHEATIGNIHTFPDARLIVSSPELFKLAVAASHALRSYRFGNSSTDLAKDLADSIDALITSIEGGAS